MTSQWSFEVAEFSGRVPRPVVEHLGTLFGIAGCCCQAPRPAGSDAAPVEFCDAAADAFHEPPPLLNSHVIPTVTALQLSAAEY